MDFKARLKQAGYSEEEVNKIENSCKIATMVVDEYGISIEDMLDKTAEFHDVAIEKTAGMTIDESEEFSRMANAGIESELAAAIILSVKTASAIVRVVNAEAEEKMNEIIKIGNKLPVCDKAREYLS